MMFVTSFCVAFDTFSNFIIRFVNLMEGQMWLESEGVGKGCTATFFVKLGICDQSGNLKQT